MEPEVFGRYRLLESIGRGGMAEVFLARQEGIAGVGRRLALKRIHPQFTTDDNFVKMFIDEARIVGHFNHPNIVQMVDFGKVHETYYIAMEFVDGLSIAGVMGHNLKQKTRIITEAIIEIGIQIGQGMDYAHKELDQDGEPLDIIHRDLTPHNILLSREGSVKITDFGIAKASMNTHMTQAGMIKGKVPYMSPEQAMGQPLDQRSDLFSIGIILYEMCTLTRLFHGPSDFHVLQKVIAADIPSIRDQNPDVPEELERVIFKILAADREDRYATAGEMVDDLRRLKFSMGEVFFSFRLADYIAGIVQAQKPPEPKAAVQSHPGGARPGGSDGAGNRSAFDAIAKAAAQDGGFEVDGEDDAEEMRTVLMMAHSGEDPNAVPEVGAEEATRLISTGETDRDEDIQSAVAEMASQKQNIANTATTQELGSPLGSGEHGAPHGPGTAAPIPQELPLGSNPAQPRAHAPQDSSAGPKIALGALVVIALVVLGVLLFAGGPKADLTIQAHPEGTQVSFNGRVVSSTGSFRTKDAPVGTPVTIRLEKAGFVPLEETLTLQSGQTLVLDRELDPELPPEGFLMLTSEPPGAEIIVAGQPTGWKTPRRITLGSGETHTMTLQLEGYAPAQQRFNVSPGKETPVTVTLEPLATPTPPKTPQRRRP